MKMVATTNWQLETCNSQLHQLPLRLSGAPCTCCARARASAFAFARAPCESSAITATSARRSQGCNQQLSWKAKAAATTTTTTAAAAAAAQNIVSRGAAG